jgi:hypothetical protein
MPWEIPVPLTKLRVSVPSVLPVVTGITHLLPPSPVKGVPTLDPADADPEREKLLALSPLTKPEK